MHEPKVSHGESCRLIREVRLTAAHWVVEHRQDSVGLYPMKHVERSAIIVAGVVVIAGSVGVGVYFQEWLAAIVVPLATIAGLAGVDWWYRAEYCRGPWMIAVLPAGEFVFPRLGVTVERKDVLAIVAVVGWDMGGGSADPIGQLSVLVLRDGQPSQVPLVGSYDPRCLLQVGRSLAIAAGVPLAEKTVSRDESRQQLSSRRSQRKEGDG